VVKPLAGKIAIVSGASSGLGREIALAYAAAGAAVVVSSQSQPADELVAEECRRAGARAIAVAADVRDEGAFREVVDRCASTFGKPNVLVAAAGIDVRETSSREDRYVHRVPLEHIRRVLDVNLVGTFVCIRETLPSMIAGGGGSIITFTSGTVRAPLPGLAAYVSSKAAIEALTEVVALEVERHGIRINSLQPGGLTDTGFFPAWTEGSVRAQMHEPSVIRGAAVYLASDDSSELTGSSLVATDWNREHGLQLCGCPSCTPPDGG
jgi:3-oxoacyl-[acyl-carrier protein] reductase